MVSNECRHCKKEFVNDLKEKDQNRQQCRYWQAKEEEVTN
jgi:hypothetical protein